MTIDYLTMLAVAVEEARLGLAEGGIPIGAALFEMAIPRCTAKPTHFEMRAASEAIATK
jgi:hypothetical protein